MACEMIDESWEEPEIKSAIEKHDLLMLAIGVDATDGSQIMGLIAFIRLVKAACIQRNQPTHAAKQHICQRRAPTKRDTMV